VIEDVDVPIDTSAIINEDSANANEDNDASPANNEEDAMDNGEDDDGVGEKDNDVSSNEDSDTDPLRVVFVPSVTYDKFKKVPCRRGFFPVSLALSAAATARKSGEIDKAEAYMSVAKLLMDSNNSPLILSLPKNGATLRDYEDYDRKDETIRDFVTRYGGEVVAKTSKDMSSDSVCEEDANNSNDVEEELQDERDLSELKVFCQALTSTSTACSDMLHGVCERLWNHFKNEIHNEENIENEGEDIPQPVLESIVRMMSLLVIRFHKAFVTAGVTNNDESSKRQKISDEDRLSYALTSVFEEGTVNTTTIIFNFFEL
jgi:hypothetical protein